MKAVILVPYRSDGAERERNWGNVRDNLKTVGIPIHEGTNEGDVFERARSRNLAAQAAGDWDVALFCDADILVSRQSIEAALMRSYLTGAYTVAYSHLHYLTSEGTRQRLEGVYPDDCESDEQLGLTWECAFAVRRDGWDAVGGFDERFRGYGGQGTAFYYAYATLCGRERIMGNAFHLDHPLVDRREEPHFEENMLLRSRYGAAVDNPKAMTKILEER